MTAKEKIKEEEVEVKVEVKKDIAKELLSDIKATLATLESEPKVHFMIPLAEGEKPGAVHDCFINGAKYTVKKGIMTQVPESIAALLANHYQVGMEAGQDFRVDLNANKQDALG